MRTVNLTPRQLEMLIQLVTFACVCYVAAPPAVTAEFSELRMALDNNHKMYDLCGEQN